MSMTKGNVLEQRRFYQLSAEQLLLLTSHSSAKQNKQQART